MAIKNEETICKQCSHISVCSIWEKNLSKLSENVKNPLPIEIEILKCDVFKLNDEVSVEEE